MFTEKVLFTEFIFLIEDGMKGQVFYTNLADFWFLIWRAAMIQWPFTDTTMNDNRNYISKRLFTRFVNVYYILCGIGPFVYFYLCLISSMIMSEILW